MTEKGLEIEEHFSAQRKRLGVRKLMWIIIAIIILTACAGWLGGRGLWATADTTSHNGTFTVRYSKFDRMKAPTSMQVILSHVTSEQSKIAISDDYLKAMQIRQISPQPDSVTSAPNKTIYTFNTKPGNDLHLFFDLEFQNFGAINGHIERMETGDPIIIRQYVFP